ncbi:MAG TPA: class I SAM-dependent methyltransferase [Acidimicrobiales bacterium]
MDADPRRGVTGAAEATGVAPDGSPVEVFRRLPPGPAVDYVRAAVAPGADILELGCGAGRLGKSLAAAGHRVVAVDHSPEMLECVEGCETVLADVAGLDLGRRFGGVVLASYLVNDPAGGERFLATCRRHVARSGAVVVQRYDPLWARSGSLGAALVGDVTVEVTGLAAEGERLRLELAYEVGRRRWHQEVEARIVGDDDLDAMAANAGLRVDRWLDDLRTWARLVPDGG